jgi:hypothetical protein
LGDAIVVLIAAPIESFAFAHLVMDAARAALASADGIASLK